MSPAKKKPTMDEILGSVQVKCRRIQGGNVKHQDELKPKLVVEVLEGTHQGETANYAFLTKKAQAGLEETAEFDESGEITILLPEPTDISPDGINWVVK
jgi:hypothetical protein